MLFCFVTYREGVTKHRKINAVTAFRQLCLLLSQSRSFDYTYIVIISLFINVMYVFIIFIVVCISEHTVGTWTCISY